MCKYTVAIITINTLNSRWNWKLCCASVNMCKRVCVHSTVCEMYVTSFHCPSAEKLAEAQRRFATLQNELQSSLDAQRESNASPGLRKRKTRFHLSQEERCKHHNIKDLKLAFSEFYLSLILLQNYQVFSASTHSDHERLITLCRLQSFVQTTYPFQSLSSLVWSVAAGFFLSPAEPELHWFP